MWQDLTAGAAVLAAFAWMLWRVVLPARARDRLRRLAGMRRRDTAGGGCAGCCGCDGAGPPPDARGRG